MPLLGQTNDKPIIVIDPGHGGKDHGCQGHGSLEKEVVLKIGKSLKNYLESNLEAQVILTRDQDAFISLNQRSKFANEHNADLFISLHCNAIHIPTVHGSESYVMGVHNNEENLSVAKRENSSITLEEDYLNEYDGFDPNTDEGHIILSLFQNAFQEKSIEFAQLLENELSSTAHRKSRGVKQAGFVVLRKTSMPSVLVELGFLSNTNEEAFLISQQGQDLICNALGNAIQDYFKMQRTIPVAYKIPESTQNNTSTNIDQKHLVNSRNPVSKNVKKKDQLNYRIQIGATKTDKKSHFQNLLGSNEGLLIQKENELFKYQVQSTNNLKSAEEQKSKLRELGFSAAFIVAYNGTEKISLDLAEKLEMNQSR